MDSSLQEEPSSKYQEHQEGFRLDCVDVTLAAVTADIENHRQRRARVSQISPGKIKEAAGENQEPENVHGTDGPHYGAEDLYDHGINVENPGGLVIPEVAIEKLAVQKSLPNDAIRGLISSNDVAKVGKRPEKNQDKRSVEPGARAIRSQQIGNTHAGTVSGIITFPCELLSGSRAGQVEFPIYSIPAVRYKRAMLT